MKTYSFLFFCTLLFILCCKNQVENDCQILNAILSVEKLSVDLKLNNNSTGYIRVLDKSGRFKNCKCDYKNFHIGIIKDIPLDFNTGRFIDIAITSFEHNKNSITIKIFYALSGQNDIYPNLFIGEIELIQGVENIKVKDSNIGNFD